MWGLGETINIGLGYLYQKEETRQDRIAGEEKRAFDLAQGAQAVEAEKAKLQTYLLIGAGLLATLLTVMVIKRSFA